MPKATTNIQDTQRYDLKSCPGGFVMLRRMTYGEILQRREMAAQMVYKSGAKTKSQVEGVLNTHMDDVAKFEFKNCIVDHNLEDENGTLLDFRQSHTYSVLDSRVGSEISDLIDKMNNLEDIDADGQGNSPNGSTP